MSQNQFVIEIEEKIEKNKYVTMFCDHDSLLIPFRLKTTDIAPTVQEKQ